MNQQALFDKNPTIPFSHKKNTRYKKHCVDCGKLVREVERVFDGIETSFGKLLFEEAGCTHFFGGYRCKRCSEHLELFIAEEFYGKRKAYTAS